MTTIVSDLTLRGWPLRAGRANGRLGAEQRAAGGLQQALNLDPDRMRLTEQGLVLN